MKIILLKHYLTTAFVLFMLVNFSSIDQVLAAEVDDPLLTKVMLDEVESDLSNTASWSAQAWLGYDLHKLWIKTEGEYSDSETQDAEIQALYSRAIAAYWDLQLGIRRDIESSPSRNWAVLGVQGLAPYFFEIDTALFISEAGRTAFRFSSEYELLITQKLILTPEVEINFYGQNDPQIGVGAGLSDLGAGLRLRYELVREFAPYIGISWNKRFGKTADYARDKGEDESETQFVIGFRSWF
ncbi:copper resistance protein B [Shewanella sp. D64]|uniref:copper resistance protein B n=1 Tax=unclassified Shewanella TaxID=196818 RepID=UPI0022BA37DE|nr:MULTISPECIES: copper resistance protein B [unclassified Shewanella]MEC4727709.1 copper resistance protein B [Shewanella sp. D64]MEC4739718.1 copper resistance protein B [Shewanella sp. E94]WBJ94103.1 copper resistance protein B [Shewanella sp. MTB7]